MNVEQTNEIARKIDKKLFPASEITNMSNIEDIESILSEYTTPVEKKITRDEINKHFEKDYPELIMKGRLPGDEDREASYGSIVYYFLKEVMPWTLKPLSSD